MELTVIVGISSLIVGGIAVVLLGRLYLELKRMSATQLMAQQQLEGNLRQLLSEKEGGAFAPIARASQELGTAVGALEQTAHLLSRAPGLEWLGHLEQGVRPLGDLVGGLNGHYETSSRLLETMQSVLQEWSQERGSVSTSARMLADEVSTLVTSETGTRRQFADTLTEMVKLFNSSVNEVTSSQTAVQGAINDLATSIRSWHGAITESTEHFQEVEKAYQRIVQKQEALLQSLHATNVDLDERHRMLSSAVRDLGARTEEIVKRQDNTQRAQGELLDRQQRFLAQFPERSQITILIVLQAMLTFVVVAFIVFSLVSA